MEPSDEKKDSVPAAEEVKEKEEVKEEKETKETPSVSESNILYTPVMAD